MRLCGKCKKDLPIEKFCRSTRGPGGFQWWCKDCVNTDTRARYAKKSKSERRVRVDYDIERRRVRVAAGGCWSCLKPAAPGRKSCSDCLARHGLIVKLLVKQRVANGLCRDCGKQKICERSTSLCDACLKLRGEYWQRLKLAAFHAYGGPICVCCSVTGVMFLNIDHINRDGAAHRKEIGKSAGFRIYGWLKKHRYPAGFQVLCWNCNMAREFNNGICPHKQAVAA